MNKFSRIVILCFILVFAMTSFAGCFFSQDRKFIGTWYELNDSGEKTGAKLVLAKYGEGSHTTSYGVSSSIKWSVEKGKFFLTSSSCGMTETKEFTYHFSFFGNKLTLTDTKGNKKNYEK